MRHVLESEPREILSLMDRDCVADASCFIADQLASIAIDHLSVTTLRCVCDILREGDTLDTRPLLQLLGQVGECDESVGSSMPGSQLRVLAAVPRVHGLGNPGPFLLALDDESVRALSIRGDRRRARAASYTSSSDTRVAGRGSENIGVGGHEHVCHHASGTGSSNENLRRVGVVFRDRVVDHGDEALVVAASITRKALLGVDLPAVGVALGSGIDGDESLLFGDLAIFCLLGVGLTVAEAAVQL